MRDLHIHRHLLGKTLIDRRGHKQRLMAIWLEDCGSPQIPQVRLAGLVIGSAGECFKTYLPDTDQWFEEKEDG